MFPSPFQFLKGIPRFPGCGCFLRLQHQQCLAKSSSCCHLSGSPLSPSPPFRDSWDYIGPTWKIQDPLPILRSADSNFNSTRSLNSLLPCNPAYSQVLGIRIWMTLGQPSPANHRCLGPCAVFEAGMIVRAEASSHRTMQEGFPFCFMATFKNVFQFICQNTLW